MVSNEQIREYAKEKFNFTPKNAHIAHAKEHYGIDVRTAHNRKGVRKWPCPPKRLEQFREIFKNFDLI